MSSNNINDESDQDTFEFKDNQNEAETEVEAGAEGETEVQEEIVVEVPSHESGNERAPLAASYKNWFLEYASYVILDRA
ncbi:MAG: DNA gyrase/topoisomerase IV subunit A, partial [Verrucomicrobiia bacterium]